MTRWGTFTLLKNPLNEVLAFVAHHRKLGAQQIHLFFDDPADPAADVLAKVPGVFVTRCDQPFWDKLSGRRPNRVGERQRHLIRDLYKKVDLDWLLHIDTDEFLLCDVPVAELLRDVPPHLVTVKAQPFEGIPGDMPKGDRIYRARHYRSEITDPEQRRVLFGPFAPALHQGMVGHRLGKSFFRVGVPDLLPNVHFANLGDRTTADQPFHPALRHLHFHGDDVDYWVSSVHHKARVGGIRFNEPYARTLLALDEAGLRRFHRRAYSCDPDVLEYLGQHGHLLTIDLGLEDLVAQLLQEIQAAEAVTRQRSSARGSFFRALLGRRQKAA